MFGTLALAALLAFPPQEGNQTPPSAPKKVAAVAGLPPGPNQDPNAGESPGMICAEADPAPPSPMPLKVSVDRYFTAVLFVWAINARRDGGGEYTPNYWQARALREGETSLPWNADIHWSLLHKPTNRETAVFDARSSTTPCLLHNAAAAPAGVVFNANWTSTLTVTSSLTTPSLTLNFGNAGGAEWIVKVSGQVLVTGTMTFFWSR